MQWANKSLNQFSHAITVTETADAIGSTDITVQWYISQIGLSFHTCHFLLDFLTIF